MVEARLHFREIVMHVSAKRLTRGPALLLTLLLVAVTGPTQARESYSVAWTLYAGSMPLAYAEENGILEKWGDRYGFDLEAVQMNDYVEAITQFSLGQFDAVIAMSLDALTIPAASGVDTTVIMPLSTSNGSDGIVLRGKDKSVADLEGTRINLVELSGSHYMLARALQTQGLSERDVTVVNTSDADIASVFESSDTQAVATWKPQLSEILAQYPDTTLVFDSSDIYGELLDTMILRTEAVRDNPDLGRAIAGAWYEAAALLDPEHPRHDALMAFTAIKHCATLCCGICNVLLNLGDRILVNKRAQRDTIFKPVTDFHLGQCCGQFFGEGVINTCLNIDAVGTHTRLTVVAEFAHDCACNRFIQIGIVKHNKGCITPQLH